MPLIALHMLSHVTVLRLLNAAPAAIQRQSYRSFGGAAFPPQPLAGVCCEVLIISATSINLAIF